MDYRPPGMDDECLYASCWGGFTIRSALCQDGDHFPFRDLQQEEHRFLSHHPLEVHIVHLGDTNKMHSG